MGNKQALDAKTLKTLKQLIKVNGMIDTTPEIQQIREQLNECVKYYGK